MTSRRTFLSVGGLAGIASLSGFGGKSMPDRETGTAVGFEPLSRTHNLAARSFIAHRGVHLGSTISGENSLECIYLAKRAGFDCIEMDVRLTSDGAYVVMHDETLNRTVLDQNHQPLKKAIKVSEITLKDLKTNYVLKADEVRHRSRIPTLEEFLMVCKQVRLLPFVEIKLNDQPAKFYTDIISLADRVMGRGNYIITSNNNANEIIRKMGIEYPPMMGILYQTTFGKIAGLNNVIMAISTSRFKPEEFVANVQKSNLAGIPTESHADTFSRFKLIDQNGIDFISTDLLAPDLNSSAKILLNANTDLSFDAFSHSGKVQDGVLNLAANVSVSLEFPEPIYFGAVYFEIELSGSFQIQLQEQEFTINDESWSRQRYQMMIYKNKASLRIKALGTGWIRFLQVKVAEY